MGEYECSQCEFGTIRGECLLKNRARIERILNMSTCLIGGICSCPEDEAIYEELRERGTISNMIDVIDSIEDIDWE